MLLPRLSSWLPQGLLRRGGCTAVVVLAVLASGCGSTNTNSQTSVGTGPGTSTASELDDSTTTNGDDNPTGSWPNSEDEPSETTSTSRPTTTTTVPVTTTLYDTDEYFEVTFDFQDYICENRSMWGEQYDCVRYSGGRAPSIFTPDLYCSGPDFGLSCSFTWYPDELDGYEFVTVDFTEYICATTHTGGWGDMDCYLYFGGSPASHSFGLVDLYCSGSASSMTCNPEWYPSVLEADPAEWVGYALVTIEGRKYLCDERLFLGDACVPYSGGLPTQYYFNSPDYFCYPESFPESSSRRCLPAKPLTLTDCVRSIVVCGLK